jgi:vacuolar-type H+-ATPase catalytic subunit A/Vma1
MMPMTYSWGSYARKQLVKKMLVALHPGFCFVLHDGFRFELEVRHEETGLYVRSAVTTGAVFREAKKYVRELQEELCYRGY